MTAALCGTAFLAWFALVEAASRRLRVGREVSRKLVHATAGLAAAAMPALLGFGEIAALALLFAAAMAASRRLGLLRSIHEVERRTWGEVCLPLGVATAAVLLPDPARYACAVAIVAISDPAACLAGRLIGGPRLPGGGKTYAGSATFLVTALVVAAALLPGRPGAAVAVAVATAVVEAGASRGLDNLAIPLAAAGVLLAVPG